MATRKKATAYRVIGAAAVIRKEKHERYLDHGTVFAADLLDEENAEHLLTVGLIEPFEMPEAEPETPPAS